MHKIKAVLFDKDGTLFSFDKTWAIWCDRIILKLAPDDRKKQEILASACGYDWKQKKFIAGSVIVSGTSAETLDAWLKSDPSLSYDFVYETAENEYKNLPLAPVCDLEPVLEGLIEAGMSLGIATNAPEEGAIFQLKQAGIIEKFDFIAGCDSGYGAKPNPGMVTGFCNFLGIEPDQVVMVGDSTYDLRAGRSAGCYCIGVLTGPALKTDLEPFADVVLDDISQLHAYFLTLK